MAKPFGDLRERLLRAGIAPRHVRRYLAELSEHLADLTAEEERAGRSRADAESRALARLGTTDELAQAIIARREFLSWSASAPWALFTLAPLCMAAAYFVAAFYLWCGWNLFLPGADTPFGAAPLDGLANFYFQAGKFYYYCAPLLVGWGIALVAGRQRLKALWPLAGLALVAWMGGTAQIQTSRETIARTAHVGIHWFFLGLPGQNAFGSLAHILAIFTLTALPWLIWRSRFHPIFRLLR
ncbi:MAG TPA: permease prefix domain 1-containing protein [Bryobacteraceae bacterium]|jgi:hypothetical protein